MNLTILLRKWRSDRLQFLEVLLAGAIALMYSESWPVFVGIVIAGLIMTRVPVMRLALGIGAAFIWGILGFALGSALGGVATTLAIAGLFFFLRVFFHI